MIASYTGVLPLFFFSYRVPSGEPFCLPEPFCVRRTCLRPENLFPSGEPFCAGYLLCPRLRQVRPGGMDPCPPGPNKRPHTQKAS